MSRSANSNGTLNAYVVAPHEVQGGDRYGYKIIAVVEKSGHFWRAYRGSSDWSDYQVANNGDEISEEIAMNLFPSLAHGRRYG